MQWIDQQNKETTAHLQAQALAMQQMKATHSQQLASARKDMKMEMEAFKEDMKNIIDRLNKSLKEVREELHLVETSGVQLHSQVSAGMGEAHQVVSRLVEHQTALQHHQQQLAQGILSTQE